MNKCAKIPDMLFSRIDCSQLGGHFRIRVVRYDTLNKAPILEVNTMRPAGAAIFLGIVTVKVRKPIVETESMTKDKSSWTSPEKMNNLDISPH